MTQPSKAYQEWAPGEGRPIIEAAQAEWELNQGDWVWWDKPPKQWRHRRGLRLLRSAYRKESRILLSCYRGPMRYKHEDELLWLPSLDDWLNMVESEGYLIDIVTVVDLDEGPEAKPEYIISAIPKLQTWEQVDEACGEKTSSILGEIEIGGISDRAIAAAQMWGQLQGIVI